MTIGACGDNCDLCPRFMATKSGSEERLAEVARLWLRLGLRDRLVSNDEIRCEGCRPENNCAYREQRDCAFGRKHANCGLCEDYPCKIVEKTLRRSADWKRKAEHCRDFALIEEAFFRKKENLDRISGER
ncbi:MAG: DUF3795 domain-containing protein [Bacteroidota bacterium]